MTCAAGLAVATATAQERRAELVTGSISPRADTRPGGPGWSGESGASGDPSMSAEAIRAAAANFQGCLAGLWPQAARRGVSRRLYESATASLTPDLRIMDLMDAQPEFTKSVWDYLDVLVTDARIAKGRELLARYAADLRRGRARLWRRPLRHRRDLGRRNQLRHARRHQAGAALDRDACLRRPPPALLP